jgi:hypothetical protein
MVRPCLAIVSSDVKPQYLQRERERERERERRKGD